MTRGSGSILLVEDDRDDLDVAVRAMRRAKIGTRIEVVRDGQTALERLGVDAGKESSPQLEPRVVFLDLKLPRVDGWEVLRRLREDPRTARLPVVVMSSSSERGDVARAYALGANSYLVKRFDPRGPGFYLAEAARYWLELNYPPPRASDRDGAPPPTRRGEEDGDSDRAHR